MELFFYDVPIYRLAERDYYAQRELHVYKMLWGPMAGGDRDVLEDWYKRNPYSKMRRQESEEKHYGGPWLFNEAIGYIRMYFLGSQIRGELWIVGAKRIVRTRKKIVFHKTDKIVPEMSLPPNATNSQIFGIILEYIESAKQCFKGRVVDDSLLRTIGPHVNWRGLIDSHNRARQRVAAHRKSQ